MEDKCNTSSEENKKSLNVSTKGNLSWYSIAGSELVVDYFGNQCLKYSSSNSKSVISFLDNRIIKTYSKSTNSLHRKVRNKVDSLLEKTSDTTVYHNEVFSELLNGLHSIQTLPFFLLRTTTFKSFGNCTIFVHEKGAQSSQAHFCDGLGVNSTYKLSTERFNHLYNYVKKSKSKIFFNNPIFTNELKCIGTFLAKEFSLSTHNLILVLSRNDFLPPEQTEINLFDNSISYLSPFISHLLNKYLLSNKVQNILYSLENISLPLVVLDRFNSIVIKSNSFSESMLQDLNSKQYKDYQLGEGNRLFVKLSQIEQTADIYHYQRVHLLGELLNTLRHELSNPMFGISLASDVLSLESSDEEIVETLQNITKNAHRCQEIIKNFTDLYSNEDSQHSFDLKFIIEEASILAKSETKGISRITEFNNETDEWTFYSNPTWISQIVFNLLVNSAQAIRTKKDSAFENYIKLSVFSESDTYTIQVEDSGPGISEENISKIFSPFFTTKNEGTGLGLSICYNLAKKCNGKLSVKRNDHNSGVTFTLLLNKGNH